VRLLLGALLLAIPATASAESAGQVLFTTHCASCHGVDGRGSGPVAGSLVVRPSDLTRLTKRYGMPLDRSKLAEYIDGRIDVKAHGPREMPVWGERFDQELGPGMLSTEDTKRRTINVIIDFLISIQMIQGAARSPSQAY
jgi:mono/diheme cytochrome c family protein